MYDNMTDTLVYGLYVVSITKLELQHNSKLLSDLKAVHAFCHALRANTTLRGLNLSNTGLTGPTADTQLDALSPIGLFCDALLDNRSLHTIYLRFVTSCGARPREALDIESHSSCVATCAHCVTK